MSLASAGRLLQAPLRGWVVPRAHIHAKPAKTPTAPSVSASKAAGGLAAGCGGGAVLRCSQCTGWHRGRGKPLKTEASRGGLELGLRPTAGTLPQLQEGGPYSCL